MENLSQKRASVGDGGPPEKRVRGEPEDTDVYSERIRERLQNSSRTGQACDRCKERKMKCDSGQDGCQPCHKANLACRATDRITGQAHERGETARLKRENGELKAQIQELRQHEYLEDTAQFPASGFHQTDPPADSDDCRRRAGQQTASTRHRTTINAERVNCGPGHGPQRGPIHETTIDLIDGKIDIAAFDCVDVDETMSISQTVLPLETSRPSRANADFGPQKAERPQMPGREEALQCVDNYLNVIGTFIPIVHGPTFKRLVADFYDDPDAFEEKPAETVMITMVLAIFFFQMATRNPSMRQEKLAQSNRLYRYSLSFFSQLLLGESLESMQALALFLIHARALPKPANSWSLSSMVLTRAIELNYHRSSKKVSLPHDQSSFLAIELRKRVFWSILGVQVTIGVKLGRPMQISRRDMDVELPAAILDSEITEQGVLARSGKCDFWGHIFLSKMLPLLMDLYQNIILVRKTEREYLQDVADLGSRIYDWRQEWDKATKNQAATGSHKIATHMINIWYAEFRLLLHHPQLCTSQTEVLHARNLETCMEAARLVRENVLSLIRAFKGPDFTWHFVSIYVLAMSIALHWHKNNMKSEHMNSEVVNRIRYDLSEWLIIMRAADRYMGSGDRLVTFFQPLVQRCLEDAQNIATDSEAVRDRYHHDARAQARSARLETVSQQQQQHQHAFPQLPQASAIPVAAPPTRSYPPPPYMTDRLPENVPPSNVAPASVGPPTLASLLRGQKEIDQQRAYDAQANANATATASAAFPPSHSSLSPRVATANRKHQEDSPRPENGYPMTANIQQHHVMPTPASASARSSNFSPRLHRDPPALNPWDPPLSVQLSQPTGMAYSPARPDNFEAIDMYSTFAHGVWPLNIVQYPNGEV